MKGEGNGRKGVEKQEEEEKTGEEGMREEKGGERDPW